MVGTFKDTWKVVSLDINHNDQAHHSIKLTNPTNPESEVLAIREELKKQAKSFDAIICTAGGWQGGSAKDDNIFSLTSSMVNANLIPALLCKCPLIDENIP